MKDRGYGYKSKSVRRTISHLAIDLDATEGLGQRDSGDELAVH
jgi:hypothetical protein